MPDIIHFSIRDSKDDSEVARCLSLETAENFVKEASELVGNDRLYVVTVRTRDASRRRFLSLPAMIAIGTVGVGAMVIDAASTATGSPGWLWIVGILALASLAVIGADDDRGRR